MFDFTGIISFTRDYYHYMQSFQHQGPRRGRLIKDVRTILEGNYGKISGLSQDIFKKRIDRIIWELVTFADFEVIQEVLGKIVDENIV